MMSNMIRILRDDYDYDLEISFILIKTSEIDKSYY